MEHKDLQILIEAAHAGGKVLRKYFGKILKIVEKSTVADFQTQADVESEKTILKILKSKFPTYNIISEEEGKTYNDSDYTIVIDPLDGTNNFVLGLPIFSVSIGLLYKGEAVAGVVYQPIIDQTYYATKGGGAYLDGTQIMVNKIVEPSKLNIIYTCAYTVGRDYLARLMSTFIRSKHKRILMNWSAAFEYCMIASGKAESMVTDGVELHDFAAGKLIALEAGAKIIDFTGKEEKDYKNNKFIVSNTEEINKFVCDLLKPSQKGVRE